MKECWFCIGYKIDNGSKTELWDMFVAAPTASIAKKMATEEVKKYHPKAKVTIEYAKTMKVYNYWKSQDSDTTAEILSVRKLSETEIIHMKVR